MAEPRFSLPESPWWNAKELCQAINVASDLKAGNQKARKSKEQ